jgi:hypothetical protein
MQHFRLEPFIFASSDIPSYFKIVVMVSVFTSFIGGSDSGLTTVGW